MSISSVHELWNTTLQAKWNWHAKHKKHSQTQNHYTSDRTHKFTINTNPVKIRRIFRNTRGVERGCCTRPLNGQWSLTILKSKLADISRQTFCFYFILTIFLFIPALPLGFFAFTVKFINLLGPAGTDYARLALLNFSHTLFIARNQ